MTADLLAGKSTLITGAASGIGQGAARVFARRGAKLVLADTNVEGGEATAASVRAEGGDAVFVRADISSSQDVAALVAAVIERHGRLDCAFNNAGIAGSLVPLADLPEESWDRVLGVNLKGVFLCMQHEIRQMLKQGGGAIVNTASVVGLVGGAAMGAYSASKHGIVGLTRVAALEYSKQGIRVNAVCPGAVRTPMLEQQAREGGFTEDLLVSAEPIGRLGKPEEIAEAAAWLLSSAASFVTGHAMAVDGGWVAQ
ncbi:3-oxoacyl-[acyl-carrier protein] reductase [Minicystis rosea]|nr:3-oxoacyl-[acyl-carrier protein] reductase [Minicystis rosea]